MQFTKLKTLCDAGSDGGEIDLQEVSPLSLSLFGGAIQMYIAEPQEEVMDDVMEATVERVLQNRTDFERRLKLDPIPRPFLLAENVSAEVYSEISEMLPRDCEYSEGSIVIWELVSGSHEGSAQKFVTQVGYALIRALGQGQRGIADPTAVVELYLNPTGGRSIWYRSNSSYIPDASVTPRLGHVGTATLYVEAASSEPTVHVLGKVPNLFQVHDPHHGRLGTDVQTIVIFSFELPPNPPDRNKRPAMIAIVYRRRTWANNLANGMSVNDALCHPDFACDFSSRSANPPFPFPAVKLSAIVGDTPGVSLRNAFPAVLPPPCTHAGMPQYQLPLALDDLFFVRTGATPGIGSRRIPAEFGPLTHISVDLFGLQTIIHDFYVAAENRFD